MSKEIAAFHESSYRSASSIYVGRLPDRFASTEKIGTPEIDILKYGDVLRDENGIVYGWAATPPGTLKARSEYSPPSEPEPEPQDTPTEPLEVYRRADKRVPEAAADNGKNRYSAETDITADLDGFPTRAELQQRLRGLSTEMILDTIDPVSKQRIPGFLSKSLGGDAGIVGYYIQERLNEIYRLGREKKEMEKRIQYLEKLTTIDSLTGLGNRRAFDEDLEKQTKTLERASYEKRPSAVSLVLFDLDHFKDENDMYGHQEGDIVLGGASRHIQENIRPGDSAYRWGGDEFAVILPNTPYEGAEAAAIRIQDRIKNELSVGVSFGIATESSANIMTPESLFSKADAELYSMKNSRNVQEAAA